MTGGIAAISIVDGPGFVLPFAVTALVLALLVAPVPGVRAPARRHLLRAALAAAAGGAIGVLLTWLIADVRDLFGISLTWTLRWAAAIASAALALAVVNLIGTRWWRKAVAVVAAGLTLLSFYLVTNVDFAQYPRLGDALGLTYSEEAALPQGGADPVPLGTWTPPAGLPARGAVGRVTIPATASGFAARDAYVYLPPAAFAATPPALPVVVALAGQPGAPADLFRAARLDALLDGIAAAHGGVAPIVVVPDQLGAPTKNPLCVDGPLGDSATYLTVDVPAWVRTHLPVSADAADWAVAGFSQGGTCAAQLGAGFPDLFGAFLDISGEEAPTLGSEQKTAEQGFDGDAAAYRAATPAALFAARAPYADTVALFAAGDRDSRYCASMRTVSAAAAEAGIAVTTLVSPGTAHDWNTARFGFREGFRRLLPRWGIDG